MNTPSLTVTNIETPAPVKAPVFSPRDFSMVIALLAIWGFFAVAAPNFVSARNISNLAVELSITAVLALGMLLIILTGNIDLSVGSGVGLLGGLTAVLVTEHHWSAPAAMALALVAAILGWVGMGALIASQRIPAFIVTLAGLMVFKGLHWKVIHNATIPITTGGTDNLFSILTTWYLPPLESWLLAGGSYAAMVVLRLRERRRRAAAGFTNESGNSPSRGCSSAGRSSCCSSCCATSSAASRWRRSSWPRRRYWSGSSPGTRAWVATCMPSAATRRRRTCPGCQCGGWWWPRSA